MRASKNIGGCSGIETRTLNLAGLAIRPLAAWAATTGTDVPTYMRERPGVSVFAFEDGIVYHMYSAYARGLDALWGMYQWLDRAPRGRNETRREDNPLSFYRRHDEYDGD